ncbi:hypothetical protein PG991_011222 [Apiospora marii]|uniref:Uncharacterized protein n=1 Tax=Apiospora marii TaxID=335849 RepID=A0ABR1RFK0_9PEZI
MASHKKRDSDNGALGAAIGGQSVYQSIADDGDAVGDNSQATPDPITQKTKKAGVFRRLSRSVRKAFTSDMNEANDPEIQSMEAQEKRWKAQGPG